MHGHVQPAKRMGVLIQFYIVNVTSGATLAGWETGCRILDYLNVHHVEGEVGDKR